MKRKKGGKLKWIVIAVIAVLVIGAMGSCGGSDSGTQKVGEVGKESKAAAVETESAEKTEKEASVPEKAEEPPAAEPAKEESAAPTPEEEVKTVYYVGDILEDGDMRIVYTASGDYVSDNEFTQPKEGNKFIFLQFAFENMSESKDASVSFYSFECYADGYNAEMFYGGDEDLSATLSAGRTTIGRVYFEVPAGAADIEVEYTTNVFTSDKITFVFEGEKDSGYVPAANTASTEGAYNVGDIVESDKMRITYLSCSEYASDNMFIQPKEGYHFVTCEFEFENLETSDETVTAFEFDCYADGAAMERTYTESDISATISAGRKAKGTVTFEVPLDASVVEVEYLTNYWTSKRVVFNAK